MDALHAQHSPSIKAGYGESLSLPLSVHPESDRFMLPSFQTLKGSPMLDWAKGVIHRWLTRHEATIAGGPDHQRGQGVTDGRNGLPLASRVQPANTLMGDAGASAPARAQRYFGDWHILASQLAEDRRRHLERQAATHAETTRCRSGLARETALPETEADEAQLKNSPAQPLLEQFGYVADRN